VSLEQRTNTGSSKQTMTTIVICGDSFCSSLVYERNHFSQLLEDQYGFKVINLARGGMSNVGICFQLKQALALTPDVIVYNTTSASRIELVLNDSYDPAVGLKNFIYNAADETSYNNSNVGNESSPIFSTVEKQLKNQRGVTITDQQVEAVKLYHTFLFQEELKKETDSWMFEHWNRVIKDSNILSIRLKETEYPGKHMYDYVAHNLMTMKIYHTDTGTQQTVANEINQIITQRLAL
jgi:hypothetical protein